MLNSCWVLICFDHFIVGRIGCALRIFDETNDRKSVNMETRGSIRCMLHHVASCCVCGFCSTCWCYYMLRLLALFALLCCSKNLSCATFLAGNTARQEQGLLFASAFDILGLNQSLDHLHSKRWDHLEEDQVETTQSDPCHFLRWLLGFVFFGSVSR